MNGFVIQKAIERDDPDLARMALLEIERLLRRSTDRNERAYLLFSRASCHGILGDFIEARRQLRLVLDESRDDPETKLTFDFNSCLLFQREGRFFEALEKLTEVLSVHSEQLRRPEWRFIYEDIQQRRSFLLVTLSSFQDALPLLREVLSFALDKETRSKALCSLGLCHLKLKDYEPARDCLLEAIALGLTTEWKGQAHFYLGIAYYYSETAQEAKREFLLCEQLASVYDLPIIDIYGWLSAIAKRLGETSESERYARLGRNN
jgi:hypothetical protein